MAATLYCKKRKQIKHEMALYSIFDSFSIITRAIICLSIIQSTSSYKELTLKNNCHLDYDLGEIELYSGDESAVVIKDDEYFSSFSGRYEYSCKFNVKVKGRDSLDAGIYAVIQDLNFRRDKDGRCLDYVEFSTPPKIVSKILGDNKNRNIKRYCGSLNAGMWLPAAPYDDTIDVSYSTDDVTDNGYVTAGDEVLVNIFIARERLVTGQRLIINIAFTTFYRNRRCSKKANELINCQSQECIDSSLMDDGIQNCPYKSCMDENGCWALRRDVDDDQISTWSKDMVGSGIGAKVTFGAVAAIILILLKFALCLWVCKRISRRRRPNPREPPPPRQELAPQLEPVLSPPATAPSIGDIDCKDLPPSYASLFPPDTPAENTNENRV